MKILKYFFFVLLVQVTLMGVASNGYSQYYDTLKYQDSTTEFSIKNNIEYTILNAINFNANADTIKVQAKLNSGNYTLMGIMNLRTGIIDSVLIVPAYSTRLGLIYMPYVFTRMRVLFSNIVVNKDRKLFIEANSKGK